MDTSYLVTNYNIILDARFLSNPNTDPIFKDIKKLKIAML